MWESGSFGDRGGGRSQFVAATPILAPISNGIVGTGATGLADWVVVLVARFWAHAHRAFAADRGGGLKGLGTVPFGLIAEKASLASGTGLTGIAIAHGQVVETRNQERFISIRTGCSGTRGGGRQGGSV